MQDINQQLHEVVLRGKIKHVTENLKKGFDINQTDQYDYTYRVTALYNRNTVTKLFISLGADVNTGDIRGSTALHSAALNGDLDITKYLISQGSKVNKEDNDGLTAFHCAASNGHLDVTEYLISQGAEVNKGDNRGWTALHRATGNGHLAVIEYLISQRAEVNKGNKDGLTALHIAAFNGHLDFTEYLITQGAEVNTGCNDGWTPLHLAVQNGHLDVIKYLISQGAKVNQGNNNGGTALHSAAFNGHLDFTEYLITQGAEVNTGCNDGWTPLHLAVQNGHLDVIKYLISEGAEVNIGNSRCLTALHSAASNGHLEVTKYLIRHGAEMNKGDSDGRTALCFSAFNGHLDVTKYLISQGVEVNKGESEYTALQSAVLNGHIDVIKYLISKGAEVNKGDDSGWTPLHSAAQGDYLDVTKYLISQGAEVNKGDNDVWTALHIAAGTGHLDVTKHLISQGAELSKSNCEGWTAFHISAQNGHLDVTKYLISQGAEIDKGNNDGRTALHSAAREGHLDVTQYLISEGAVVKKGDNMGWTALDIATENGHLDVIKYLISEGAEVHKSDYDRSLYIAAENGHLDVTKYLIGQGAEVNKGGKGVMTALHLAAQEGHLDVTEHLISQGAEVNKGNNRGLTALHYAIQNGHLEVVKVLLTGGARSDTRDIDGHTPEQFALFQGYRSIVDLFINHSYCKLEQNDLTGIHLAIQDGHTSTIEKLVSEGADLNVQSSDGQTCLHRAIKLCYTSGRVMHDTDTLKEISDEYYKGELSPEKALVFYLLENGAKSDVRDTAGNLPIQYAKDEVVKQMILSRLPLEEIQSYRDEPSTSSIGSVEVGMNTSKDIELEDHGVSLFIPSGAVHQSDRCKVTLTLLQGPPSVDIQDDESVICYGIRCDPPNMIFHQPVKIRIPHYFLVVNPDQVKPNIVSRVLYPGADVTITVRKRSSSSPHEPPYCRVYKRHLELYIGKCAEWWVLIPLEQQVIQHQLICTPYIPDKIEKGQEFEVQLQMHADLPGMETDIRKEKKQQSYHKSHCSVPFSVESKSGDITVTCHREGGQVDSKVLSLKDVCGKMRHNILLSVTPTDEEFTGITITITQAGSLDVSLSIAFIIRHTDGQEYLSPSEPLSFLGAVEEVLKSDLPDIDVLTIAQTMTVDKFYDLGVALGFTIQQLDVIEYRRFRDREQAIFDMLVTWRERQPSGQAAKEAFPSLMKSLDPPAEEIAISDIGLTGEIPDRTLLAFARQIRPKNFFEIGEKLGFNTSELQHIEHRILYNRENANIQMLSSWKASQTSGPKAKQTLKLVWESVQDASKAEKTEDSGKGIALLNTKTAGTSQALAEESDQETAEAEKNDYDNLTKKAQSDGTDSVESVDHALGLDFLEAAHEQGPSGGQTMTREPTAATNQPLLDDESSKNQVGKTIQWDLLTDSPQELTLQDNEVVISCGVRFTTSGAKLSETFKVTLDHNAHFTNPRRAEIVFYTRNKDSTTFVRIPASTDGCPARCDVRSKDLDLYVDHFSDWWIVALITRFFVGKRVKCTPYVCPPVTKGFMHLLLLCIYDDLFDVVKKINEEMKEYRKLYPPQPMFVEWRYGDITIELFDGSKENKENIDKQILGERDVYLFESKQFSFEVKPLGSEASQRFLEFTLDQAKSSSYPTLIRFDLKYDAGAAFCTIDAGSQSAGVSMLSCAPDEQKVTDANILKLAGLLQPDRWRHLHVALRIDYSTAERIRKEFSDLTDQYIHLLQTWKAVSTRTRKDLNAILIQVEAGGLVDKYVD